MEHTSLLMCPMAKALALLILTIGPHFSLSLYGQTQCNQIYTDRSHFQLYTRQVNPRQLISFNLQNLMVHGQLKKAKKIIEKISQSGDVGLNEESFLLLKSTRKYAAILRSSFQATTARHKSPAQFDQFVRDFGRLNDLIAENISKGSKDLAKELLKKYKKMDFETLDKKLDYANQEAIYAYFHGLKKHSSILIEKDKLSLEEFHEVRKNLKEFLNYFRIVFEMSGKMETEFRELDHMNNELGAFNDQLTAQVLRGERKKTDLISYPPHLRDLVDLFLSQIRIF